MNGSTACLFPAFGMKYRGPAAPGLEGFEAERARLLARAATVVAIDRTTIDHPGEPVPDGTLEQDLQEHCVAYAESCAIGNLLQQRGFSGDYAAGYSMGVFAAMYHGAAVSFEDGLRLLWHTCSAAHAAIENGRYGMGVVIGFTSDEIRTLIDAHGLTVEVADVCGPRTVIVSGQRADLANFLDAAEVAGSIQARLLPFSVPFHSAILRPVEQKVRALLDQVEVTAPACGVISCVDQALLASAEDVREELARNVARPIRWLDTMRRLLDLGVKTFFECGQSDSLHNLGRSMEGDFQIYHPRKCRALFASEPSQHCR